MPGRPAALGGPGSRLDFGAEARHLFATGLTEHIILVTLAVLSGMGAAAYLARVLSHLRLVADIAHIDLQHLATAAPTDVAFAVGTVAVLILSLSAGTLALRVIRMGSGITCASTMSPARGGAVGRTSRVLACIQVALAIVCVAGAVALVGIARSIRAIDPGFAVEGRLAVSFGSLRFSQPPSSERLLAAVRSVPSVLDAAIVSRRFGRGADSTARVWIDSTPMASPPRVELTYGGPRFLDIAGIRVMRGRALEARDEFGRVGLLNEAAAARIFPGVDPVGHRIRFSSTVQTEIEIVGIVANTKLIDVREPDRCAAYLPLAQHPDPKAMARHVIVHCNSTATPVTVERVREVVSVVAPDVPVNVESVRDVVEQNTERERSLASVMTAIAVGTTALAIFSIVAIIAVEISVRGHEVAVRVALGATPWKVLAVLSSRTVRLLATGGVIGVAGSRALSTMTGLGALVPAWMEIDAIAVACVVVSLAISMSTITPLVRAARTDPITDRAGDKNPMMSSPLTVPPWSVW